MYHYIGNYIFDSERLIFYPKDAAQSVITEINTICRKTDNYEELKSCLDKLDKTKMSAKNKPINLIGICLTYNCQLRCNYCSYSSTSGNQDLLSVKDILVFVKEAIKKRKIYQFIDKNDDSEPLRFFFTGGGEPTFNWELFKESIRAIKNLCDNCSVPYYFELTTNGMLNNSQRKFIIKYFDKIMLSYDGTSFLQNRNRKCSDTTNSSPVVEKTLQDFSQSGRSLTVRSTVWYENFENLKQICDNIANNSSGINEWSIMPIIPSGRALKNGNKDQYNIEKYDFFHHYVNLHNYAKEKNYKLYISTPIFNNTIAEYCCGATFAECFWLMPDRKIINCIEAEQFKTIVAEIKDNMVDFYNSYTDQHLDVVKNSFDECRGCIAYRFCKGGCPLKVVRDNAFDTKYRDYECQLIRKYWSYVFTEILCGNTCFGWKAELVDNVLFGKNSVYKLTSN